MSPTSPLKDLSPAQLQRLSYIEYRVWFFGEVARKDVLERFGLATAAGTRDMVLYRQLAPGNVLYEAKTYRHAPTFQPLFQHPAERVLAGMTTGIGVGEPLGGTELIPHAVPARLHLPDLETLATVSRAIHQRQPLRLRYHSMKTGAVEREIVPHALVDSGVRWHVRAYDRTKGEFRDLVITRMESVTPIRTISGASTQAYELASADEQWNRVISLELVPHPSHRHPLSVAKDFGMTGNRLVVELRAAVAGYVLRQWQVDCSPDGHLTATEFRLRLANLRQLEGVGNAVLAPGYGPSGTV
jgi:hypothetical protein